MGRDDYRGRTADPLGSRRDEPRVSAPAVRPMRLAVERDPRPLEQQHWHVSLRAYRIRGRLTRGGASGRFFGGIRGGW